jgi:two-component system, LuxR family, sensor kinase FixL
MLSKETQALMEAAVDAVIVIDHQCRILAVNEAVRRTFGFRTDELLGENVSMLMPEPERSDHDGYMARYLETGVAKIIGIGRDVNARRKDGSIFPAHLSVGRVPDSKPPRFVGLLRDVSAERDSIAALKLQHDRARAFLELHDSILLELDERHCIREINTGGADLLGAPASEIVGRDWVELMCGENERTRARLMLTSALGSGSSREREFSCLDASGEPRQIYWRCIGLRATPAGPARWLCSGIDVTERAEREQSAHVAQERLTRVARLATMGEMASGVAHELNQPLTAITTYARACERYLAMSNPDMQEVSEAVKEIGIEGLRAGEIIRRLRQMVRGDPSDERSPCEVNALIEELRSLLQSDARVHDSRLRISLSPNLPPVVANAVQLQQVVLNLVRNAFEALVDMPAGARDVQLTTQQGGDGNVEIRVADNGPGVAPTVADRLFHPFSTTKSTGTGLGLAISRTIVESHGGTIATQAAEPKGAIFTVRLPAAEESMS